MRNQLQKELEEKEEALANLQVVVQEHQEAKLASISIVEATTP
jgi:hypothetical protein